MCVMGVGKGEGGLCSMELGELCKTYDKILIETGGRLCLMEFEGAVLYGGGGLEVGNGEDCALWGCG